MYWLAIIASTAFVGLFAVTWFLFGGFFSSSAVSPISFESHGSQEVVGVEPSCPKHSFPLNRPSDVVFATGADEQSDVAETDRDERFLIHNNAQMRALFRCMEDGTCAENQEKVIIVQSYFLAGTHAGWTGGESIWGRSVLESFANLGYTYLFSPTIQQTIHFYRLLPHNTISIWAEPSMVEFCLAPPTNHVPTPEPWTPFPAKCLKTPQNPTGIPLWKILAFYFWPGSPHPLGANWTLSPEPYELQKPGTGSVYLGYSVQDTCALVPFVPHAERETSGKKTAYVMAKQLAYFAPDMGAAWPTDFYDAAAQETGVLFVVGADPDDRFDESVLPQGMLNHGRLEQKEFLGRLGKASVLIGIGNPANSPSPYDALCLGVPFINPIIKWNESDPWNKQHWESQHPLVALLGEPYVYNVHVGDKEGFVRAIREALHKPIESYVLDRMRKEQVQARVHAVLETDWRTMAAELLERRADGDETAPVSPSS
ncbi:hypothetical protein HWV62_40088 [Athelia sp. TMB]|nr:hypothetical protein HWV62_40088 [Athelia sp. TMB]